MSRIFLLSPATCTGQRAQMLLSPRAQFALAGQVRSAEGAALGDVFSFLSGLYFRGKLAYARAFARPPRSLKDVARTAETHPSRGRRFQASARDGADNVAPPGVFVITPSLGLQLPEYPVTIAVLERFARVQIESANPAYREPLAASARLVADLSGPRTEVVLLGSIATGKYVDVLLDIFGDCLRFPVEFVGRGDMSRGGLMLRCVRAGQELTYVPVKDAVRHGPRPPRLEPLRHRPEGRRSHD